MKRYLILLFILIALVQWYVPGKIILNREEVLKKGKVFRFQTEPVDPEDPFRGRYVALSFTADTALADHKNFRSGEKAFAEVETDTAGFVRLKQLYKSAPASKDYVGVKIVYFVYKENENEPDRVMIEYPFEEFYLDEYKAPKAETIYRDAQRNRAALGKTYALVSIYKGKGVIKDLIINDRSVYSYFK